MKAVKDKFHWIAAACLLAVLLLAAFLYWDGLNGPFVLDDRQNVQLTYVEHFNWNELVYETTHNVSGTLGRPVSALSFVLTGLAHGPNTWGYKYHNLLIHLLNGLLIFWLLLRLLPYLAQNASRKQVTLVAGAAAACWLLHPLMVSTVLYAVQRMTQLSTLFTLLALLMYVLVRESASKERVWSFFGFVAAFFLFLLLALFSKENGALIPIYVFAIEFIAFGFLFSNNLERNRVLGFQLVFVLLPVLSGAYYLVSNFDSLINYSLRDFTMVERLMTQLHVVVLYLKLILLPNLSDMTLYHDDMEVVRTMDPATTVLLVGLLIMIGLVFYFRKKAPVISFGIAWFIISHLLESTLFSLELVFEHRNYLASLGLMLIVFYYLLRAAKNYKTIKLMPAIFLALMAFMTHARVMEWRSADMFYTMAVNEHPLSYRVNTEYANYQQRRGNFGEAIKYLEIAQDLEEKDYGSVIHNVFLLCNSGNYERVDALYEKTLFRAASYPASPYSSNVIDALSSQVFQSNCPVISPEELLHLIEVAQEQSNNIESRKFMGFLQRQEGLIHFHNGNYVQGFDAMVSAYNNTKMFSILVELVEIQLQLNQVEAAEESMVLLENINKQSWGIESFKINELYKKIAEKRRRLNNKNTG